MKLRYWLSTRLSAAIGTFVILGIIAMTLGSIGQAATYLGVQNVSQDGANSLMPHVAQDPAGNVHVVWDSTEGSRQIRWRKGTWNGTRYTFGPSVVIANVGAFQYSTPSIAVSPDGTVLAVWSNGFQLSGRKWNMNDAQPSGATFAIMPGFDANVSSDSNNHFHIVANGEFNVQYCELIGTGCARRDSFSRDLNATPDVTVDKDNGVHLIWSGQGIRYRYRPSGGQWGNIEVVGSGNVPQIAADGQGSVHLVWSQDYNIQYCRKNITQPNTGCAERFTGDASQDLSPSIGATRSGSVMFAFYDSNFKRIWANTRENGRWSPTTEVASGPTRPDLTSRPYSNRISAVWSVDYDISLTTVALAAGACDNTLTGSQLITGTAVSNVQPQAIPANGEYLPMIFGPAPAATPTPTATPTPQC